VNTNQKQWLTWVILTLVTLAIALFFGVQYPMPEQPEDPIEPIELAAHFSNPVDIEGSSSAAAPALTFEGDTDTGLFRSAANTLNVSTAGTEQLEIDAAGLTVVPPWTLNNNLTVTGTANLQGSIYDSTGATTVGDQLEVVGQENAQQFWVQGYTTQTANLITAYSSALATYFAVEGDGLVNVGAATPSVADADNDLAVAGVLEVDTEIEADGPVDVDGSSDAVQLSVTGYTTQTSDLVTFDGGLVDIGGASAGVADGDNDLAVAGVLEVDGELEADGAIDADSTVSIASWISFDAQSYATSAGGVLTPTATFVDMTSAGAHTITIADGTDEGQLLIIHHTGPGITIDESEYNGETGGDISMNATDVAALIWDGSKWKLIAHSSN
jgi:cytoskeletal protein CcmA (bactofilin family)